MVFEYLTLAISLSSSFKSLNGCWVLDISSCGNFADLTQYSFRGGGLLKIWALTESCWATLTFCLSATFTSHWMLFFCLVLFSLHWFDCFWNDFTMFLCRVQFRESQSFGMILQLIFKIMKSIIRITRLSYVSETLHKIFWHIVESRNLLKQNTAETANNTDASDRIKELHSSFSDFYDNYPQIVQKETHTHSLQQNLHARASVSKVQGIRAAARGGVPSRPAQVREESAPSARR